MSKINDGGRALKAALNSSESMDMYLELHSAAEIIDDIKSVMAPEITRRDHFAAAALPAVVQIVLAGATVKDAEPTLEGTVAVQSFAFADAMLAASEVQS